MPRINDAEALRDWLRGCPAIAGESAFGVDYLGDVPGSFALRALPSEVKYRTNILGGTAPLPRQSREYALEARAAYGAEPGQNLENLELFQAIAGWMLAENAAGRFPEWEEGRVTAILPAVCAAPEDAGSDSARYRLRIRVEYEV